MFFEKTDSPATLAPGDVHFDADPATVRAHEAWCDAQLADLLDACSSGTRDVPDELLPLLRERKSAIAQRIAALEPAAAADPLPLMRLYNLRVRLDQPEAVQGLLGLLGHGSAQVRRFAAVDLQTHARQPPARRAIRAGYDNRADFRAHVEKMALEADRWNRRMVLALCLAADLPLDEGLWRRLLAETPDPRGETEGVLACLARRGLDLGAVDLAIRLLSEPAFRAPPARPSFHVFADFLRQGDATTRAKAEQALLDFLRETTPADAAFESWRDNARASAIDALAAARSPRAHDALQAIAHSPAENAYPRNRAWVAYLDQADVTTWRSFLESGVAGQDKTSVLAGIFGRPRPDDVARLSALARELVLAPWPPPVLQQLTVFLREHDAAGAPRAAAHTGRDETRDFDALTVDEAAALLVRIGAIEAAAAATLVARVRAAKGVAARPAHVLEAAELIAVFDAETAEVCPRYATLLALLAKASRGLFTPRSIAQTWHCPDGVIEESVCTVRFVWRATRVDFAPRYEGDFYDVKSVLDAVNGCLARAGIAQRFVLAGNGDQMMATVFATPDVAPAIARIIGMPVGIDAAAARASASGSRGRNKPASRPRKKR